LTHLRYGLTGRPGLTVLVGEAGTGKTTLVRSALDTAGVQRSSIVHLSNPTLTRSEFFEYLASGFGFSEEAAASKTRFLRELESAVSAPGQSDAVLALIVDEAQSLPYELLEEIRLLTNIEVGGRSVAVALVGQPELAARLNDSGLRQLKQRIALRCELVPLTLRETAAYIAARVRVAGGSADGLFTRDAVITIHERSHGIPRTISVICDNALVNGFAVDRKPVGRDIVLEVCRDFELNPGAGSLGPSQESNPWLGRVPNERQGQATPVPAPGPGNGAQPEPALDLGNRAVAVTGQSNPAAEASGDVLGIRPVADERSASKAGWPRRFSFFGGRSS
jgi:type II secretory pathway predicted ATPase ExeA